MAEIPFVWPQGRRAALSLTFDDARLSQVDVGLPILNAAGVRATFYVSPPNVERRIGDWRAAVASGHEIGNHTLNHPCSGNFLWSRRYALETYDLKQIECEITGANAWIDATLGVVPRTFAYPCGQKFVGRGAQTRSYVPVVARHFLAGRGFREEIPNDPKFCDLAQLAGVDGDGLSFAQCRAWIDRAIAEEAWLIIAAHEIGSAGYQTMPSETLIALCQYAAQTETLWTDTVAAIADYIQQTRPPSEPLPIP
jgi:hypothetical protein